MAQALVPLKDLVQAKSRLAGLLSPSERRALAQAMVEDVLVVLSSHADISLVTLVSDDPCAELLATRYGLQYWSERSLGCEGLNAIIGCASARLLAAGNEPLLTLHGDLPLLGAADISAAVDCQRALGGLVIGCDRAGSGTNLLAFGAGTIPTFHFGPDSCHRHQQAAGERGIPTQVISRHGIALDIDEPRDLEALLAAFEANSPEYPPTQTHTAALLRGTPLGARMALALATLGHDDRQTTGVFPKEQTP